MTVFPPHPRLRTPTAVPPQTARSASALRHAQGELLAKHNSLVSFHSVPSATLPYDASTTHSRPPSLPVLLPGTAAPVVCVTPGSAYALSILTLLAFPTVPFLRRPCPFDIPVLAYAAVFHSPFAALYFVSAFYCPRRRSENNPTHTTVHVSVISTMFQRRSARCSRGCSPNILPQRRSSGTCPRFAQRSSDSYVAFRRSKRHTGHRSLAHETAHVIRLYLGSTFATGNWARVQLAMLSSRGVHLCRPPS